MAREQEDVTKGQEDVTKGQEQVELEEPMEVEEAGAVKSRDGGDPRALPPLWPPKPLPVEVPELIRGIHDASTHVCVR